MFAESEATQPAYVERLLSLFEEESRGGEGGGWWGRNGEREEGGEGGTCFWLFANPQQGGG